MGARVFGGTQQHEVKCTRVAAPSGAALAQKPARPASPLARGRGQLLPHFTSQGIFLLGRVIASPSLAPRLYRVCRGRRRVWLCGCWSTSSAGRGAATWLGWQLRWAHALCMRLMHAPATAVAICLPAALGGRGCLRPACHPASPPPPSHRQHQPPREVSVYGWGSQPWTPSQIPPHTCECTGAGTVHH